MGRRMEGYSWRKRGRNVGQGEMMSLRREMMIQELPAIL